MLAAIARPKKNKEQQPLLRCLKNTNGVKGNTVSGADNLCSTTYGSLPNNQVRENSSPVKYCNFDKSSFFPSTLVSEKLESMHKPVTIRCVTTSSRHTSQQRTSSTCGRRLRGGTSAGPGASWQSSSNWWQQLPTSQAPRVDEAMREHLLPRDELSMRKVFCLNSNEDSTGQRRTARESRGCDRDRWWLRTTGVTVDEKQRSRELDLWTSLNGVPVLCLTVGRNNTPDRRHFREFDSSPTCNGQLTCTRAEKHIHCTCLVTWLCPKRARCSAQTAPPTCAVKTKQRNNWPEKHVELNLS